MYKVIFVKTEAWPMRLCVTVNYNELNSLQSYHINVLNISEFTVSTTMSLSYIEWSNEQRNSHHVLNVNREALRMSNHGIMTHLTTTKSQKEHNNLVQRVTSTNRLKPFIQSRNFKVNR